MVKKIFMILQHAHHRETLKKMKRYPGRNFQGGFPRWMIRTWSRPSFWEEAPFWFAQMSKLAQKFPSFVTKQKKKRMKQTSRKHQIRMEVRSKIWWREWEKIRVFFTFSIPSVGPFGQQFISFKPKWADSLTTTNQQQLSILLANIKLFSAAFASSSRTSTPTQLIFASKPLDAATAKRITPPSKNSSYATGEKGQRKDDASLSSLWKSFWQTKSAQTAHEDTHRRKAAHLWSL